MTTTATAPLVSRHTGRPLDADSHFGGYGPGVVEGYDPEFGEPLIAYREGLLSEHVEAFRAAGGTVRFAASGSGRAWAVRSDGRAVPVVCGYIIEVFTEDGRDSGRCGADAYSGTYGMCEGHGAECARFMASTEAERLSWERDR